MACRRRNTEEGKRGRREREERVYGKKRKEKTTHSHRKQPRRIMLQQEILVRKALGAVDAS